MDIEQYDASDPEKYLKGILHSDQEPWVGPAYQSYLAVLPSPIVGFDEFATKVCRTIGLMTIPDWNLDIARWRGEQQTEFVVDVLWILFIILDKKLDVESLIFWVQAFVCELANPRICKK